MSASQTGDVASLSHCLTGPRNVLSASSPAARTASARNVVMPTLAARSASGNGQALHTHGRSIGAPAEFEVVGGRERGVHGDQIAGDRDFAYRVGALAVLNPEAAGTAAIVAGDAIDAEADQLGDVKALGDIGDQFIGRERTRFEIEVGRPRRRRAGDAALGMPGGL